MINVKIFLLLLLIRKSLSEKYCPESSIVKLSNHKTEYNIRFPNVHTSQHDEYMCTGMKTLNSSEENFIKSFEPHAKASRAHHLLVYGCQDEVKDNSIWKCRGENMCPGNYKILYAWARNAKAMKLPDNVGFGIGANFNVKSFVLQIHYRNSMKNGETDCSGISMVTTNKKQNFYAGIYLIASSNIRIPAHGNGYGVVSCVNNIKAKLNVFAYRTHTHDLGKVATAYRVREGETKMIGKGNPTWPEAFYMRERESIDLQYGDKLIARCDYASNRNVDTFWGYNGGNEEMCNYYMMYYTLNKEVSKVDHECWNDQLHLKFPPSVNDMCPYPGYAG